MWSPPRMCLWLQWSFMFSSLFHVCNTSACCYLKERYLYVQGASRNDGAQDCREAYKLFLLLFIAWKVTADDTERHNICVSHSAAAVEAHTSYWGKAEQCRESAMPWYPTAVWCTGSLWAERGLCCHLTWQCSSSLESFGAFNKKIKFYMIVEREGDFLTYRLEFSLPFKSNLTCSIDTSFKRWEKRWRTSENKVKNNPHCHIGSEWQWLPSWERWPSTWFDCSMCCQGPGPLIRTRALWSTCRE